MQRLNGIRTRWIARRATFALTLVFAGTALVALMNMTGIGTLTLGRFGGMGSAPDPLGLFTMGIGLIGLALLPHVRSRVKPARIAHAFTEASERHASLVGPNLHIVADRSAAASYPNGLLERRQGNPRPANSERRRNRRRRNQSVVKRLTRPLRYMSTIDAMAVFFAGALVMTTISLALEVSKVTIGA